MIKINGSEMYSMFVHKNNGIYHYEITNRNDEHFNFEFEGKEGIMAFINDLKYELEDHSEDYAKFMKECLKSTVNSECNNYKDLPEETKQEIVDILEICSKCEYGELQSCTFENKLMIVGDVISFNTETIIRCNNKNDCKYKQKILDLNIGFIS